MSKSKSKRSKACNISKAVREAVYERDDGLCVVCGGRGIPNAHYIRRSHNGLGIEKNVVCLCLKCHNDFDNGSKRHENGEIIKQYLMNQYDDWNEQDLVYNDDRYSWAEFGK